jgi:hypothetical protein
MAPSLHIRNQITCHYGNNCLPHHTSETEKYAIAIGTKTPVITHQKMNNMPLQLEQTLCDQTSEAEQHTITIETNTPIITHQKLNNMPLQFEQTPLSSHIRS